MKIEGMFIEHFCLARQGESIGGKIVTLFWKWNSYVWENGKTEKRLFWISRQTVENRAKLEADINSAGGGESIDIKLVTTLAPIEFLMYEHFSLENSFLISRQTVKDRAKQKRVIDSACRDESIRV